MSIHKIGSYNLKLHWEARYRICSHTCTREGNYKGEWWFKSILIVYTNVQQNLEKINILYIKDVFKQWSLDITKKHSK